MTKHADGFVNQNQNEWLSVYEQLQPKKPSTTYDFLKAVDDELDVLLKPHQIKGNLSSDVLRPYATRGSNSGLKYFPDETVQIAREVWTGRSYSTPTCVVSRKEFSPKIVAEKVYAQCTAKITEDFRSKLVQIRSDLEALLAHESVA